MPAPANPHLKALFFHDLDLACGGAVVMFRLPSEMAVLAGARELCETRSVALAPLRNIVLARIFGSQTKERDDTRD